MIRTLIIGTACAFGWTAAPLTAEEPALNPRIGHLHHHASHRPPRPTVEPSATRFFTTREAAKALRLPAGDGAFQFVVFGDRTGGPPAGVAVLADAVRDVKLLDPDLVITVGDMVQGYNEQPEWLAQTAEFSIFIGDRYLNARAPAPVLRPGAWHHLAGVYDGREARLYLDGSLLASAAREGRRKRSQLPLVIGADVTRDGGATSHFTGAIDYVRVSRIPRYLGPQAAAAAQPAPDPDTCLLLQLDELLGLRTPDSSPSNAHAARHGSPSFVPAR